MDTFLKKIPALNKIYNLKQHILNQEQQLQTQERQIQAQQQQLQTQQERMDALEMALQQRQQHSENLDRQIQGVNSNLTELENGIKAFVSKEIVYKTISLQQRLDQFIFDFKISAGKNSVK